MTDRFDAALDYLADLAGSAVGDKDRSKVREAVADVRAEASDQRLRERMEILADTWGFVEHPLVRAFVQRLRANLEETP